MTHVTGPTPSSHGHPGRSGLAAVREYLSAFPRIVLSYGLKGLIVLIVAALLAFAPLSVLYWINEWRLASVWTANQHGIMVVKPGQWEQEQEQEEPGETALLQVICETTSFGQSRPLLRDDDPHRSQEAGSLFVNRERVYMRPAARDVSLPFALLGKPPVSVWVPAGDYQILVVHEAPADELRSEDLQYSFPLVSTFADCKLENKQKTICRVQLPHYGIGQSLVPRAAENSVSSLAPDVVAPFVRSCENVTAWPTPEGFLLALDEPVVHHQAEHQQCVIDFDEWQSVPREWTREQLASVRNWLPDDATSARARLSALIDSLGWRQFLQGWYCYAAAGITGLIFTRWGAIAILEPWRRGESFFDTVVLLGKVFFVALAVWCVFLFLTNA